jgi:hypothetical protein
LGSEIHEAGYAIRGSADSGSGAVFEHTGFEPQAAETPVEATISSTMANSTPSAGCRVEMIVEDGLETSGDSSRDDLAGNPW